MWHVLSLFKDLYHDPQDADWGRWVRRWLLFSFLLHVITAIFSVGHHSADEYFQILEFASFKLGWTPRDQLAVEFSETMRPWLLPAIAYGLVKVELFLGIASPLIWAMSLRMLSGLFGWLSTCVLAAVVPLWFADKRARKMAILAFATLWFLPVLHVRPSSESWAASAFLLGLGWLMLLLERKEPVSSGKRVRALLFLGAGALISASFEFRFQMGLMIAGLLAWLVVFRRQRISGWEAWGGLGLGLGLVFFVGRAVDAWGYGRWVLSPWHYVDYNLIRGEVSRYGQEPWWDVFRKSATESWPVLGLLLALATLVAWIRHPKHVLTWVQVPFFLVHEWIAHKELRFFFPIALAGPILLPLALVAPKTGELATLHALRSSVARTLLRWVGWFLLIMNGVALFVLCFLPFSRIALFWEGVYHHIPEARSAPGETLWALERDPFDYLGTPVHFYRPQHLQVRPTSVAELQGVLRGAPGMSPKAVWIAQPAMELPLELRMSTPSSGCIPVFRSAPQIFEFFNWGNWLGRTHIWTLWKCGKTS